MRRRFAAAVVTAIAAVAVPATAAAQTSPDVAARAFADAGLSVQAEIAAAQERLERLNDPPACSIRAPRKHRAEINELKSMLHVAT